MPLALVLVMCSARWRACRTMDSQGHSYNRSSFFLYTFAARIQRSAPLHKPHTLFVRVLNSTLHPHSTVCPNGCGSLLSRKNTSFRGASSSLSLSFRSATNFLLSVSFSSSSSSFSSSVFFVSSLLRQVFAGSNPIHILCPNSFCHPTSASRETS